MRKRSHSLTKLLSLIFAFALIAAACGGSDEADEDSNNTDSGSDTTAAATSTVPDVDTEVVADTETERQYGGTITVGLEAESPGFRPWEDTWSSPAYNMGRAIYDPLLEYDVDGAPQPWLAESISPNEDFTVWTLTLRDGITFHNGEKVTAQTLADMFAVQQTGAVSAGPIGAANLTAVVAVDALTVEYQLSQTNSAFPDNLARSPIGYVFDPALAVSDSDGYAQSPVGTGPFMMDSRDVDNATVVVRNPDYWLSDPDGNQLPYLDSITFRPIPDENTRLDAVTSGTADVMQTLRQGTIRDTRDTDLVRYEFQGNNAGGGMYNVAVAPFDDVRVRNALTLMNNQDAVIESLGGAGISDPATQIFSQDDFFWSQAAADAWPKFDFEAGKAKMQEYVDDPARSDGLAVGSPISIELSCPPDPTLIAAMQVLEQLWTASGLVEVELTQFDQQTHINRALGAPPDFNGDHQAHCWRWGDQTDPATYLNPRWAPTDLSPLNFQNHFDAELFGLLQQAVATDDRDARKALYEQVSLIIARDTPIWFSGGTATMIATTADVSGINGWHLPGGELGIGFPQGEGRYHEVWRTDLG